jgi:hypothetical protein
LRRNQNGLGTNTQGEQKQPDAPADTLFHWGLFRAAQHIRGPIFVKTI